jgi:uncharacterized membrane protein YqiK
MTVISAVAVLWYIIPVLLLLVAYRFVLRLFGVVLVPQGNIGIVNKRFVLVGSNRTLPEGQIIALNGEAGIQADTLAPGVHYFLYPWQYNVKQQPFLTVAESQIGIVESKAGKPLSEGRVLGKTVACDSFQNTRAFLTQGGERGPQMAIIPPGTYRINTELFTVKATNVLEIPVNSVGIVTVKEGKGLTTGDIAGPEVPNHNSFQDPQAFVTNGGYKGLQEQVLLAGRYFLNPMFATVEVKPMTIVPIANVGVVISYVGKPGVDQSGDSFKHGNIVQRSQKGVWMDPLDPGKYPINPYTTNVELVPTANVVLNWANNKSEAHKLDERLSTITVRSSDGFKFNLDVSQIIHIARNNAPKVIARFGNMINLVTQVLEPTIGNYFRNAAQKSDVIDFLKDRETRQKEAKESISAALVEYDVEAEDTLIGDIVPPEDLMKTLTDRKIADQQRITFQNQKDAQDERTKLQEATALADTQTEVVQASRHVIIAEYSANAAIKAAEGEARSKTINAEADANVITVTGNAEAGRTKAVGTAEADVIKLKINSMEAGNYAAIETAKALASGTKPIVPQIMAGGDGKNGGGTLVDVLLAQLIANNGKNGGSKVPA